MSELIGLGGYSLAGKDAIADVLEENGFKRTKMAADLELALLALNPWVACHYDQWTAESAGRRTFMASMRAFTRSWVHGAQWVRYADLHAVIGYDLSKENKDVREYLQKLGTEVGRKFFGENCWVDARMRQIDKWQELDLSVVITGIRFHNELDAVMSRGGKCVWVERPGIGPVNTHTSDNTLGPEDFEHIFHNNGTLEDLAANVKAMF